MLYVIFLVFFLAGINCTPCGEMTNGKTNGEKTNRGKRESLSEICIQEVCQEKKEFGQLPPHQQGEVIGRMNEKHDSLRLKYAFSVLRGRIDGTFNSYEAALPLGTKANMLNEAVKVVYGEDVDDEKKAAAEKALLGVSPKPTETIYTNHTYHFVQCLYVVRKSNDDFAKNVRAEIKEMKSQKGMEHYTDEVYCTAVEKLFIESSNFGIHEMLDATMEEVKRSLEIRGLRTPAAEKVVESLYNVFPLINGQKKNK